MTKKFFIGSLALAAMIAGPAMAADMPVKAKAPPPVAYYDWSGAYVGFNAGGMWTEINRHFIAPPGVGDFSTSNNSDFVYGFHAGAQWQWGQWILGVEAAYSACGRECRSTTGALPVPLFTPNTAGEHKLTNLFTVGPRLGYAWDRWMIYGTGGYAIATMKGQYRFNGVQVIGGDGNLNAQTWNDGWFAGGGLEYMAHKGALVDVILGAEYQHFDVREKTFCFVAGCNPVTFLDFNHSAQGDIVRARMTIKTQGHGWWGNP
jgi:outer membrane immunogenic protein